MTLAAHFWSRVAQPESSGCREWLLSVNHGGYGRFRYRGRMLRAHRVAWEMARGPVPEGLFVLHHCDNPRCVRTEPDDKYPEGHLFLGTLLDNNRDRHAKGRTAAGPRPLIQGERHWMARLNANAVRAIRELAVIGWKQKEIAPQFGVSAGHVGRIVNRTQGGWAHVA